MKRVILTATQFVWISILMIWISVVQQSDAYGSGYYHVHHSRGHYPSILHGHHGHHGHNGYRHNGYGLHHYGHPNYYYRHHSYYAGHAHYYYGNTGSGYLYAYNYDEPYVFVYDKGYTPSPDAYVFNGKGHTPAPDAYIFQYGQDGEQESSGYVYNYLALHK